MTKKISLIAFIIFLSSCSSKKDILFIQDSKPETQYNFKFEDIKIMPDDILRIKVSSSSLELSSLYTFQLSSQTSNSIDAFQIEGYLVNSDGYINIPSLKPIMVKGLSVAQVSDLIQQLLKDQEDLKNVTVDVKILNSYFTVLGEVNKPGRYNFLKNNLDIFEALGIAGDLTINGKRNDVKIISKVNGNLKVDKIDLTSSELFMSENFQIFPGDIIIVNANNARVKNAGLIGNFGNLLSVLSFLLSTVIVIGNNS